jgi:uncharacterized membrane protein YdcZ (DUF606 family)
MRREVVRRLLLIATVGALLVIPASASADPPQSDDDWAKRPTDGVEVDSPPVLAVQTQSLQDGGFEAGFPNPFWTSTSSNVVTNICSAALCGTGGNTALPRSGNWWAWFGGFIGAETATVAQSVNIPRGDATLSFYLWFGSITTTGTFTVDIDGDVLFTVTESDLGVYGGAYRLVELDVSAYADSKVHNLRFTGHNDFGINNISLDDVALVVEQAFVDDNGHTFEADIEWLADEGITKGCNPPVNDRFCPDSTVTRGQMAAFLVRALNLTDTLDDPFGDDDDSIFEADIEKLAAAGITKGCNPPTNDMYCPDSKVTRGQMAAFLVRAIGYVDDGGGNLFIDDDGSVFETDIDKLGTAGVTKGCNPPTNNMYCPNSVVTRGQMAAFLHRALG